MKKTKNIILKSAAVAALFFLFIRATKSKGMRPNFAAELTPENIKNSFKKIFDTYGYEKTKRLEQMFRNESGHFKSGQFKKSFSPGMESVPNNAPSVYPFGWKSLDKFAKKYGYKPEQFYQTETLTEGGTGKPKRFVGFPSLFSAMLFVMFLIENRGWNFGKWFSFDETLAANYNSKLDKIKTPITDSFL